MLFFVCKCQGGFVLTESSLGEVSTAARRFGADPNPIGQLQSTSLPPAASIELIDLVQRKHFAFVPHARARELALDLIIEGPVHPPQRPAFVRSVELRQRA
jgi:hypothetical protein